MPNALEKAAHAAPSAMAQVAQGFVEEGALADAIVVLDRALHPPPGPPTPPEDALLQLCDRYGLGTQDPVAQAELLTLLSSRLEQMTHSRAHAFEDALKAYPPEQRFSLQALTRALWPILDNLRAAGVEDVAAYTKEIARFEPQLHALYQQGSGRSTAAWEATWSALTLRVPGIFARHAALMSPKNPGFLSQALQTPEGVGVVCGALGLLTLRMPVSTPLVSAVLATVGYAGVAPLLEKLKAHLQDALEQSLAAEDAVITTLHEPAPVELCALLATLRPVLLNAVLCGASTPAQLQAHVKPLLDRTLRAAREPGGPGQEYALAVEQVVEHKYLPRFSQAARALQREAQASLGRRALTHPHGAGLATAVLTAPISLLAAQSTPWGLWDAPLMAGLFFLAGHTLAKVIRRPQSQLDALDLAMLAEERVIQALFARVEPPR